MLCLMYVLLFAVLPNLKKKNFLHLLQIFQDFISVSILKPMLTHRAVLYDESALDLVVFNGLHQPGNCNKTLSEGENPLVVLLLFIQSNSSFKSKLKHAYLDRFSVTVFVSAIYPFLGKFKSCFTIAILAMLLGSSSSISSSQIVWNFLPFSRAPVSRVSRSPSLFLAISCTIDVISLDIANVLRILSPLDDYEELAGWFESIRNGEILWMHSNCGYQTGQWFMPCIRHEPLFWRHFVFYIYYHFFFHWTETAPVQEVPPPRPPLPTEATAPPPRPPLPSDEMVEVQQVLEQPPEDNRMAVCLLLTSCNDCSQFSTLALPIINLFNPPPPPLFSLPKRCFRCLLGVTAVPRENEGNNSNLT